MPAEAEVAEVLGIEGQERPMSLLGLAAKVDQGLPLSALDRLVRSVAPNDAAFAFRLVPRATLARRRKAAEHLSPEEGAKVARLAEVWALALEVWGSDEDARDFLFRRHMLLGGRRPVDVVLANEFGRPIVENILGGILYGTAV